jgi:TusE/DsrC/DsvC family sulfur relay protein
MQVREIIAGHSVHLDAEGYLSAQAEWTAELAEALAREAGIVLTPRHWQVIAFCREDAAKNNGLSPGLRRISQLSGVSMKELYALFPKGPGKLAARIAGLPKPKSCL